MIMLVLTKKKIWKSSIKDIKSIEEEEKEAEEDVFGVRPKIKEGFKKTSISG